MNNKMKIYTKRINIVCSDDEFIIFKKLAHKKELALSDLIRKLLNSECEKENISIKTKQEQQ